MYSPFGETIAQTKSPPSRLPLENDLTICPCMFIITTVFERLHTTKCSGFLGSVCTLFTVKSAAPSDLYVPMHSVVFKLHTFTVPSEDALKIVNVNQEFQYLKKKINASLFSLNT